MVFYGTRNKRKEIKTKAFMWRRKIRDKSLQVLFLVENLSNIASNVNGRPNRLRRSSILFSGSVTKLQADVFWQGEQTCAPLRILVVAFLHNIPKLMPSRIFLKTGCIT